MEHFKTLFIKTRDLFPDFVGFVSDINLKEILSNNVIMELDTALNKYAVLVFNNQNITDSEQIRITEYFGKIESASGTGRSSLKLLSHDDKPYTRDDPRRIFNLSNRLWHTDSSFNPIPAKYSLLSGKHISKEGGNTEFADMRSAYDNLDVKTKNKIEKMICEHSKIYSCQRLAMGIPGNSNLVEHPLVRENRLTKRKSLFLSSHIGKIKDWTRPDSMCFIDDLIEYATKEKFLYVHKWMQNNLVIWDNRQTMHRARAFDDLTEYRDMRRTTVLE